MASENILSFSISLIIWTFHAIEIELPLVIKVKKLANQYQEGSHFILASLNMKCRTAAFLHG